MLTIEECRALIPESGQMDDEKIAELRENLYALAGLALETYDEEMGRK